MKSYDDFVKFLDSNQICIDLIVVSSESLRAIAQVAYLDELNHVSNVLGFAGGKLQLIFSSYTKLIKKHNSGELKKEISLIDFFDNSQIYLDILSTCYDSLQYVFNNNVIPHIRSISCTVNFAIEVLVKEYSEFTNPKLPFDKNNQKGGKDHE